MPPAMPVPAPLRAAARRAGPAPEPLLTLEDAADLLRVSTRTVRRLIAAGELAALRVGRQRRLTHPGLRAYLHRQLHEL